jgi:hypothetical protein
MDTPTGTPSIAVAIGRETRLYHAFVTTAPTRLDAPATVTLYAATLSDVSGMAADPITLDTARAKTPARLILVEGTALAWQRARCREGRHLFAAADPVLVGLNTLQHWLWQRLTTSLPELELATSER